MFATTGALAPQRSALQRSAGRGMSLATREQKAVMTDFAGAGAFRSFGRQKNIKERLEEKYK